MEVVSIMASEVSTQSDQVRSLVNKAYAHGFYTPIDSDTVPPGLNEETIYLISAKKKEPDFLLQSQRLLSLAYLDTARLGKVKTSTN